MQSKNICVQNVFGNLEQKAKRFIVSLEGNEKDVINVFRSIWELAFLYDGYFYTPCKYNVDGAAEDVEQLYFLSFYDTGRIWKNCANTLVGPEKNFQKK